MIVSQVQNLIERCLQLYMTQRDVVSTLQSQANIEPSFTRLSKWRKTVFRDVYFKMISGRAVWQKLEEQNPDFFKSYYVRLRLKEHIHLFNQLLEQQINALQRLRGGHTGFAIPPGVQYPGQSKSGCVCWSSGSLLRCGLQLSSSSTSNP